MTEDELDLLASVYLDGEATPEEVAVVERDPAILARVEELRALSGQVAATPGQVPPVKEHHLAAAMAVFDAELGPVGHDLPAPDQDGAESDENTVVDFRARAEAKATAATIKQRRPAKVGGLPSWMPAAAVFILIGGGVLALVANTQGSDDAESADAGVAEESTTEADDSGETQARDAADSAEEADMEMAAEPLVEDDATDDAMAGDDAMEEEAMEDSGDDEGAADGDEPTGAESTGPASTTTVAGGGGFFPREPVLVFDELPPDLYEQLTEAVGDGLELRDPQDSNCGGDLPLEDGVDVFGYVPVEIAGLPAELFAAVTDGGEEFGLLVDAEGCVLIE